MNYHLQATADPFSCIRRAKAKKPDSEWTKRMAEEENSWNNQLNALTNAYMEFKYGSSRPPTHTTGEGSSSSMPPQKTLKNVQCVHLRCEIPFLYIIFIFRLTELNQREQYKTFNTRPTSGQTLVWRGAVLLAPLQSTPAAHLALKSLRITMQCEHARSALVRHIFATSTTYSGYDIFYSRF